MYIHCITVLGLVRVMFSWQVICGCSKFPKFTEYGRYTCTCMVQFNFPKMISHNTEFHLLKELNHQYEDQIQEN